MRRPSQFAAILMVALAGMTGRARAQAPVFYAGAGGNAQQGSVPWVEQSGPDPQEVLDIEFFGSVGSTGLASATADRGLMRSKCAVQNPAAGLYTPQIHGNGTATVRVFDATITGPPGSPPVEGTLHLSLNGDLSNSGPYPWTAGVSVTVLAGGQEQNGFVTLNGSGLQSGGLLGDQTSAHVSRTLEIPATWEVGSPFSFGFSLTASAGGTSVAVEVNTGDSNFSDGGGLSFPLGTPVLSLPEGYTLDIPSLNVVDNLWPGVAPSSVGQVHADRYGIGLRVQPNPMSSSGTIAFNLSQDRPVRMEVFDQSGRRRSTLLDGWRRAGPQSLVWNGRDSKGVELPVGIYFIRLQCAGETVSRKVIRVR